MPPHTPLLQVTVTRLLVGQTFAQAPQLFLSVLRFTSQPLVSLLLSQSANPVLQAPLHTPIEHVGVMMLLFEQSPWQVPQCAGSVLRFTSQPSTCLLPLQSAKPGLQAPAHTPLTHTTVAMLLPEQTTPQPPQLLGSLLVLISQ